MAGVVAFEDVADQQRLGFIAPVMAAFASGLQSAQGIGDQQRVQALAQRRFAQGLLPAATEVEAVMMEGTGSTGNVAGQLAEALFQQVEAHHVSLG